MLLSITYTNADMALTVTAPATNARTNLSQTNLPSTTVSGSGGGATFDVTTDGSGNLTVKVNNPGSGYVAGNQVKILGSALTGGASPANILLTVSSGGYHTGCSGQFTINQAVSGVTKGSLDILGLQTSAGASDISTTDWVDEKAPL